MLASLLALADVVTYRLLLCHLSGLLEITGRTLPSGTHLPREDAFSKNTKHKAKAHYKQA
jgi:hypothetical protein